MNLILGSANFNREGYGKKLDKDECFKLLDRAKELGIETVATAFDYGYEIVYEYGWQDILHKPTPGIIEWNGIVGKTVDELSNEIRTYYGLLMAPLNPLNHQFIPFASYSDFVARSIFCGGKLQRSNKEDVARLCFGFLKSHDVKNCVFGVESIEELELNVRVANDL